MAPDRGYSLAVSAPPPDPRERPSGRAVLRVVLVVVASALALYLLYRVRTPLGYLVLALFVAICASGPVNALSRRMPRAAAIVLVYLGLVLAPLAIAAILVPPVVGQSVRLVNALPAYAAQLDRALSDNEQLRRLNEDYDLTAKLTEYADELAAALGRTAGALAGIGAGLVGSLFAFLTILVLSVFMVARGRSWLEAALATRRPREAQATRRALDHMTVAVGGYVVGALAQATVAGVLAFVMLLILGVPAPLPLAVVVALFDMIPMIGATLGGVIVGAVTLFSDFPADTIGWALFAIAYQPFENYVLQPRIQSRAVSLDPFLVVVAALFGAALLGVLGALLAIPAAAVIQIGLREYLGYRRELSAPPTAPGDPAPAPDPPASPVSGSSGVE